MPNIKEIVNRMHSISSMRQITKTMKLIAASKFNRAQQNILRVRYYEKYLEDIKDKILGDVNEARIKKFCSREKKDNLLLVVCTADKGFCGAFNNATIKKLSNSSTLTKIPTRRFRFCLSVKKLLLSSRKTSSTSLKTLTT